MTDILHRLHCTSRCDIETAASGCHCAEARDEITRLRNELHLAQDWSARVIAGQEEDVSEITRLRAANERLRAALTPSAETKAAYIGEFHFTEESYDEDGQVYYRKVAVPWTIIKEIMAAISARAALDAFSAPKSGWAPTDGQKQLDAARYSGNIAHAPLPPAPGKEVK